MSVRKNQNAGTGITFWRVLSLSLAGLWFAVCAVILILWMIFPPMKILQETPLSYFGIQIPIMLTMLLFFFGAAGVLSNLLLFLCFAGLPVEDPAVKKLRVAALIFAVIGKIAAFPAVIALCISTHLPAPSLLWGACGIVCIILLIAAAIKNRKRTAPSGEKANNL